MIIHVASLGHMKGGINILSILGTVEKFVLSKFNYTLFQTKRR